MCKHILCGKLNQLCVNTIVIAPVLIYNFYDGQGNSFGVLGICCERSGVFQGKYNLPTCNATPINQCYNDCIMKLFKNYKLNNQMYFDLPLDAIFALCDGSFAIKQYNNYTIILLHLFPGYSRNPIKSALLQERDAVITDFEYIRIDSGVQLEYNIIPTTELVNDVRMLIKQEDINKMYC